MPFCTQCGNQVARTDYFCARCGARQTAPSASTSPPPPPPPPPRRVDIASGVSPRTASILCYIPWVGWVAAIVVLASNAFRENRTVRFHAFQGLYLFVAWLIVQWVLKPLTWFTPGPHVPIAVLLQLVILALWIFMIVKTSHDETYALPVIGDLAERSLAEH